MARAYVVVGKVDEDGERLDWVERVVWTEARAHAVCAEVRERADLWLRLDALHSEGLARLPRPARPEGVDERAWMSGPEIAAWVQACCDFKAAFLANHPEYGRKPLCPSYYLRYASYSWCEADADGGLSAASAASQAVVQAVAQEDTIRADETVGGFAARVAARAVALFRALGDR